MSQLRASINFSLREKELKRNQTQFWDLNASPIEMDSEDLIDEEVKDLDDDDEDDVIVTSDHWEQELKEWEEMLKEEKLAQLEEEEELRDNSNINMEGDLLNEYIHPAIDKKAKWELRNLFSSTLDAPNYLNVESA